MRIDRTATTYKVHSHQSPTNDFVSEGGKRAAAQLEEEGGGGVFEYGNMQGILIWVQILIGKVQLAVC